MNIKVDFDNIVVKEDKNDFNVKVLMLKGEKGDAGDGEPNVIEKVQVNGTDLPVSNKTVNVTVPIVDSTISSSSTNPVQNNAIYNALSNKVDTSTMNNYYQISEVDALISGKPYSFNNVADMKSYNLQEGDYAVTKGYYNYGDGGHAQYLIVNDNTLVDNGGTIHELSNGLKAKLMQNGGIFYKVFGTLENALLYATANPSQLIIVDNITISETLNLPSNLNLEIGVITYTGVDYAINLTDGISGNIHIKGITANNGGGVNFLTSNTFIARLKLNVDNITCGNKCMNFTNSKGVFNCSISGKNYNSQNDICINIDSNGSYVGQIDFNVERLEAISNYAIYISSLNGSFTGANFNYCSLEGSANGIYLEFTSNKSFELLKGTFRVMEITGTQLKVKGNMTYLTSDIFLTFDRIRYNLIDVTEVTWQTLTTATIYINGHIVQSTGNNEISSKAMIKRNYVAIIDFPEQFANMTANVTEWNGTRPITLYRVDPSLASDVRLAFRIPSWVCPETGRHIRLKLSGKNTTIRSPKNKWLHEYNSETGTLDIYAQSQGTTIQFNGYLNGVLSWSLYEQD